MQRASTTAKLFGTARLLLVAVPVFLLVAIAAAVIFSAQHSFNRAAKSAETRDRIGYTLQALQLAKSNVLLEPVASRPSYSSAVFLDGNFYLAGPAGLTIAASDGSSKSTLRSGIEIPVAPIVAVTTGRLRGTSEPQVLLATAGAGVLLLQPGGKGLPAIQQLLPADPALRDLTAVLPLASGDLLLGTRHHGVLIYNGASLTPFSFVLDGVTPSTLQVTALAAQDAASFLIGTRNQGAFYVHAGTVQQATASNGLPDNQVEAILVEGQRAYVATPLGTAEVDLSAEAFRPGRILGQGLFSHSLAVDKGQLFIGTLDQGVQPIALEQHARFRRASILIPTFHDSPSGRIDAFAGGPDGLYALAEGALVRRENRSWTTVSAAVENTLSDRNISALAFAPDGSLYVGFFDHGLDILSPDATQVRHHEDDHLFCINRLALDPQRHTIAAATANGLVLFDVQGNPRQTLTRRDGLISDHVTDIAFIPEGTALATPAGITFLKASGAESLYAFQGLVSNHVYALASAAGDKLLAGTLGGLSLLQGESVQRNFTVANSGLNHNWITALLPTTTGGFLVGTYGAGLESLDAQGNFSRVELPTGTPGDLVINPNALLATPSHLYAGTLGHGLLVYTKATSRWSSITAGLPSLNVTAFAARNSELYIGTENGLVRIPEANLP